MEPFDLSTTEAAEAALAAYRAARRSMASRSIADDVALARFRAYFPLATASECRHRMLAHLVVRRSARQRVSTRPGYSAALVVSN
jgi:hypothetical protein